jgi:ribosomal subunit interface protein
MNYNLKGTDVSITDELREYVEKKLQSLDKLSGEESARVDIVVAYLETEEKQYFAEMTLHDTRDPMHTESRAATLRRSAPRRADRKRNAPRRRRNLVCYKSLGFLYLYS